MDCDRCGGAVETFELDGHEAHVCQACGYVDTAVEHDPQGNPSESWDEAIQRFYDQFTDEPPAEE